MGVFLLIFFGILFVSGTPSRADDPVTVVQYPLINRPALVLPGESLSIECEVSSSVSGWKVTLSGPYKDVIPSVSPGEYVSGVRKLTAVVPQDAPYELYDLRVQSSGGIDDVVRNCVRILPEYKDTFTFVHLPDCHLPAVAWIGFYDDPNSVSEFEQITKELNIIHPEFILQTGDLVDNGRQEDQFRLAQELLEEFEVPVFITGGNHDLWHGHANWHRYFGKTMDYSFRYGATRLLGLEMYDTPSKTYTAEQMKWLRTELDGSIVAGEESRIIFTHYDESQQLTGEFLDQYLIDGIFYGHTHINADRGVNGDADTHTVGDANRNTHADADGYTDADRHTDSDADRDSHSNAKRDADADADRDGGTHPQRRAGQGNPARAGHGRFGQ